MIVQLPFIHQTCFSIIGNYQATQSVGFDLLLVVLRNIRTDCGNSLRCFNQHSHFCSSSRKFLPIEVIETTCQLAVGFTYLLLIDVQFNQPWLEVELFRGTVSDRSLETVPAHVAIAVFLSTKGIERVAIHPVDRRTG